MPGTAELLNEFIIKAKDILRDNLTGIYLHGSLAMGCFNEKVSDIDLLVVIRDDITYETKREFMDMVVSLNDKAPQKGIELSIVKESVCDPFIYPTPYELHFSEAHLDRYLSAPDDYIRKMNGADKDLAAHFTIIYHRGKTLYGKEIKDVFQEVGSEYYLDSIIFDIQDAKEDILTNPMYIILNLCRVLAYKKDGLILSKKEGGEWALNSILCLEYKNMILTALEGYKTGDPISVNDKDALNFSGHMLELILGNDVL